MKTNKRGRQDVGLRRHRKTWSNGAGVLCSHEIMSVTKVAYRFLKPGVVVRAEIPYADGTGRKVRPSIVVSAGSRFVELMPCTSSPRATRRFDVAIHDLASAGLLKATKARTDRTVQVDRVAVIQVLGRLSAADRGAIFASDHEVA